MTAHPIKKSFKSIQITLKIHVETIVAEKKEPLQGVGTVGGRLFLNYLKDVSTQISICDYQGNPLGNVQLPGLGNASGFGGEKEDKMAFFTYSSFNFPPTIYQYDVLKINPKSFKNLRWPLIQRIIR